MASFSQNNMNPVDSKKLWTDAISIISSKDLSADELAYLSRARREDVLEDIKKFETQNASSSIMRAYLNKHHRFSTVFGRTPGL